MESFRPLALSFTQNIANILLRYLPFVSLFKKLALLSSVLALTACKNLARTDQKFLDKKIDTKNIRIKMVEF